MLSKRSFTTFAALAVTFLSVSACGGGGSSPSSQQVAQVVLTGLAVSPNATEGVVASMGNPPVQFTAIGTFNDGSSADLTASVAWSSSDPAAAAFSSGAGVATPVAVGSTVITATDAASGLHASVNLSIVPQFVVLPGEDSALLISPIDPTILVGTQLQLSATASLLDDGTLDDDTVDMTAHVLWTSSDEAIATVSQTGLATAVSVGSCTITATDPVSGITASITFGVTDVPAALAFISMSKGSAIGGTTLTGTVWLTSLIPTLPTPGDPIVITLTSSRGEVVVPESVTILPGAQSVSFEVTTSAVTHPTHVNVYASDGTITKRARVNLRPPKKS